MGCSGFVLEMSGRRRSWSDSRMNDPLLGGDLGISKDRRRFIVLSIFDFSLVLLLWMLCTVSAGGQDLPSAFIREIDIFSPDFMRTSLFDVVLVVFIRMIVLIICYAVLRFSHWLPVAITTATSSLYFLLKVLFFFSHKSTASVLPQYLLILASFIVSWIELWFMPFRVLPRERHAQEVYGNTSPATSSRRNSTRQPVIAFSDDDFRSALEFSSSEDEHVVPTPTGQRRSKASYIKAACSAQSEARRLLGEVGRWKALRQHEPIVRQSEKGAFYVKATFPVRPSRLWEAVWINNLRWNDQVLDAKEVLKVDERTVLFYSVSAPAMRGYIASRDFLDVRRVDDDPTSGEFAGYFMSVDSHLLPPNANKKIVRGTNGPSMMRVFPATAVDGTEGSTLEWVMQTELKGGLPKRIVQSNMLAFFVNNMARLKAYLERPPVDV